MRGAGLATLLGAPLLRAAGCGCAGRPLPVVTGQDAELPPVRSVIAGEQAQTVFEDTRALAAVAVDVAGALLRGEGAVADDVRTGMPGHLRTLT